VADPIDPAGLAQLCKILSVDTRIGILQLLQEHPLCVNALAARLGVTHSAVSQHLRILRDAGLVRGERRGYWVHYSVDEAGLQRWREQLGNLLERREES
jgi:DNA-binding transcriptional ArsR family regulator